MKIIWLMQCAWIDIYIIHFLDSNLILYRYMCAYMCIEIMQWKPLWIMCVSYAIPAPKINENILEEGLWRVIAKLQNPQSIIVYSQK